MITIDCDLDKLQNKKNEFISKCASLAQFYISSKVFNSESINSRSCWKLALTVTGNTVSAIVLGNGNIVYSMFGWC